MLLCMENIFEVGNGFHGFYGFYGFYMFYRFYGEGGGFAASIYGAMPQSSMQDPSQLRLLIPSR